MLSVFTGLRSILSDLVVSSQAWCLHQNTRHLHFGFTYFACFPVAPFTQLLRVSPLGPQCTAAELGCSQEGTWDIDLDRCQCVCMDGYFGLQCENTGSMTAWCHVNSSILCMAFLSSGSCCLKNFTFERHFFVSMHVETISMPLLQLVYDALQMSETVRILCLLIPFQYPCFSACATFSTPVSAVWLYACMLKLLQYSYFNLC